MFGHRTQISFSRLWGGPNGATFKTDEEAKKARDSVYWAYRKQGVKCRRESLEGQLRKYWGLGDPCGQVCTVYYLNLVVERN